MVEGSELWAGARVRWIGPAEALEGVRLEPGMEAVVTDPGPYALSSVAVPRREAGRRKEERVRIELADGQTARWPRITSSYCPRIIP